MTIQLDGKFIFLGEIAQSHADSSSNSESAENLFFTKEIIILNKIFATLANEQYSNLRENLDDNLQFGNQ
jgi:hypothetical protein